MFHLINNSTFAMDTSCFYFMPNLYHIYCVCSFVSIRDIEHEFIHYDFLHCITEPDHKQNLSLLICTLINTVNIPNFVTRYRVTHMLGKILPFTWFRQLRQLVGRYCSCLLPRQDGGTSQILSQREVLPSWLVTLYIRDIWGLWTHKCPLSNKQGSCSVLFHVDPSLQPSPGGGSGKIMDSALRLCTPGLNKEWGRTAAGDVVRMTVGTPCLHRHCYSKSFWVRSSVR